MPPRRSARFLMDQRGKLGGFSCEDPATNTSNPIAGVTEIKNYLFDYRHNWANVANSPEGLEKRATKEARFKSKKALLRINHPALQDPQNSFQCKNCFERTHSRSCNIKCYLKFRSERFEYNASKIEIRRASPTDPSLGNGVFVKAGQTIMRHAHIGEYIGRLLPASASSNSAYQYELDGFPDKGTDVPSIVIDSGSEGNWTRFINSRCRPNLSAVEMTVGKIRMISFRATRTIHQNEQLFINYGAQYFIQRQINCRCDTFAPYQLVHQAQDVDQVEPYLNQLRGLPDADDDEEPDNDDSGDYEEA